MNKQTIIISTFVFFKGTSYICILVSILICIIKYQTRSLPVSLTEIDRFLIFTSCGRLIRNPDLTLTANELTQLNNEASSFLSFPNDCSFFTHRLKSSSDESTYPLAFTILIHSNLEQFDFLLHTIYRPSNFYCIHIDLKSSSTLYQSIIDRSKCVTNIYFPGKRLNVTWGHFSVLEAEHLCQKELLKQSNEWKYYFNLANSDIPLKTNTELIQILKLYNEQNDITSLLYRSQARQRKSFTNRTLYKGEFHVLLTREAVEHIHTNPRIGDLYNYLNGTLVPDEHYYSTINRWKQTPGFYPYDHDLSQMTFMTRYKIWNDRPEAPLCHGGFVRTICVFNYQDLWHLATSPHLFANKIFFQRDRIVPYCLAKYLDIRKDFSMIDENFYRQLKNIQYKN